MSADLDAVVARLEGIASRLEASEARLGETPARQPTSGGRQPQPDLPSKASPAGSGSLQAWDSSISPLVSSFKAASESLGSEVQKAGQVMEDAFKAERNVVEAMTQCQKPDMAGLQQLVTPVGAQIQAADKLTQGKRTDAFTHSKAVAEAIPALSWVVYSGPNCGMDLPAEHVENTMQSAEFWTNKVLLADRSAPSQEWVKSLKELLKGLAAYVKQYHATGPAWQPSGIPISQFRPGAQASSGFSAAAAPTAAPAAAPARRGAPGPPPPMPAGGRGSLIKDVPKQAAAPAAPGMNALFSELNKGDSVTRGLKKVTDDMKAKNRADRTGTVSASTGAKDGSAAGAKPGRTECEQGRKWVVEHHVNNPEIIIAETNPKQAVYIYGCKNSTVQVKGKVNALSVDSCQRLGVVFEDLVSSCELINSSRVQVQVTGVVPTIAIDKCDGVQLYISATSLGADITTAKSSEVNVMVPGSTPDADLVEHAIPEQYVSQYKGSKYVTLPVSHSGG